MCAHTSIMWFETHKQTTPTLPDCRSVNSSSSAANSSATSSCTSGLSVIHKHMYKPFHSLSSSNSSNTTHVASTLTHTHTYRQTHTHTHVHAHITHLYHSLTEQISSDAVSLLLCFYILAHWMPALEQIVPPPWHMGNGRGDKLLPRVHSRQQQARSRWLWYARLRSAVPVMHGE